METKMFGNLVGIAAAFAVVVWAMATYLSTPEVHLESLSGECVRVINADGSEGSCEDLPKKYLAVWI